MPFFVFAFLYIRNIYEQKHADFLALFVHRRCKKCTSVVWRKEGFSPKNWDFFRLRATFFDFLWGD